MLIFILQISLPEQVFLTAPYCVNGKLECTLKKCNRKNNSLARRKKEAGHDTWNRKDVSAGIKAGGF